jgi:hypothetical protein
MRIGQVYRYSRPYCEEPMVIDELENFFYATSTKNSKKVLLESGVNTPAKVSGPDGIRSPVILLRSSPHKIGSDDTPWQDHFEPDNGHIRYYGDSKNNLAVVTRPETQRGNKALLEQFDLYTSKCSEVRASASPILCFQSVPFNGKAKGAVKFEGLGIIKKIERVVQHDAKTGTSFTNFAYDLVVLDISLENEVIDWRWITARRDKSLSNEECLHYAPSSWKRWVKEGDGVIQKIRRSVSKLMTTKAVAQKPKTVQEKKILEQIYSHYTGKNAKFEALASVIAARVIRGEGNSYREGWVTASGSDGGADFIGRLDVGTGFSKAKLIVLGQAKCEKLNSPTGGNHIARTVARLRRGWIGVYVTTSYFSEAVQREVIDDKYPILLINGLCISRQIISMMHEQGIKDIKQYLKTIDIQYELMLSLRQPEEILLD